MKKLFLYITLIVLAGSITARAVEENAIFNSGFELGNSGFICERYLRIDTNPKLLYTDAVTDKNTFTSGTQSLLIPNKYAESFDLQSREFKLVPGEKYTFSIDMKSSIDNYPVTVSLVTVKKFRRRTAKQQKQFIVGKDWKRYIFQLTTYKKEELEYYYLRIDNGKILTKNSAKHVEPPAADLWLDSLYLKQGDTTTYMASGNIESTVIPENKVIIKNKKEVSEKVKIALYNSMDEKIKSRLTLYITDVYSGKLLETKEKTVTIASGKKVETSMKLKLTKFGSYRITADFGGKYPVTAEPACIAVVQKVDNMSNNYDYDFSVGLDGNLGWRKAPMKSGNVDSFIPGYRSVGQSPEEDMKMAAQMGCRVIRAHNIGGSFDWSTVEPEEGKFYFRHADYLVEAAERNGIKLAPCIGTMEFMSRSWGPDKVAALPEWLQKESPKSAYAPMLRKYKQDFIYLPPVDLWKRYIRKLAERYKGKITHWEIMNEPNLFIIPKDYNIYLKAAHSVLKSVDKNNKIVGFCATGDLGGSVNTFLGQAFSQGGLEYTDIVAFHPYHARTLASPKGADTMISEAKDLFKKFSDKKVQLWNTELYFLRDKDDSGYYASEYLAHRFLTDLGEGVSQSISLQKNIMMLPVQRYYQSLASSYAQFPDSNYVIYNTLAHMFMGAKPIDKIKWPSDCICYVYEKNGLYTAALWHYGDISDLKLSLNISDAEATLYDLFGNQIAMDKTPLNLTAKPYYLVWKGTDKSQFIKKLHSAKLNGSLLLKAGAFRVLMTPNGWQGVLGLINLSTDEIKGEIKLQADGLKIPHKVKFDLPGGVENAVTFPIELAGGYPDKLKAVFNTNGENMALTVKKCFAKPVVYTAEQSTGKFVPISKEDVSGKAKHQAEFSVKYDSSFLYIDVKVNDDTPSGEARSRSPWCQDCIELMIDTSPEKNMYKNPEAHNPLLPRIFILPYAKRKVDIWRRGLKQLNINCQVNTNDKGYTASLKIPFAQMNIATPVTGKSIGFEILVDNVKGASTEAVQLRWNSSGKAHKNRGEFGLIYFK